MKTESNRQWLQKILPSLVRQGWRHRWGSKHLVLYPADRTKRPFTVSGSPSDPYARNAAIREIKKSGGIVEYTS